MPEVNEPTHTCEKCQRSGITGEHLRFWRMAGLCRRCAELPRVELEAWAKARTQAAVFARLESRRRW